MSHKRARESTSDKENSSTPSVKHMTAKKQRLNIDNHKSGQRIASKNKVHAILQEQARARYTRDVLTPPPSSEMDVQLPEQDEEQYAQPRKVQPGVFSSFQERLQTPSSPMRSSSPFLPTTPLKEDSSRPGLHALPLSLATLSVPFDGTHNLILGRSRKNAPGPSSAGANSNQLVRGVSIPTSLPAELADKLLDPLTPGPFRPTRLVPLPRKAQHTSRHHVLVAPSSEDASHLLIHVMGQNGCRVRVLGGRPLGSAYERKDEIGAGKRYTAGRVVTIRSPHLPRGSKGLVVDIEIDMYSCKTIIHWSVPANEDLARRMDEDEDETESEVEADDVFSMRSYSRAATPEAPSGQNGRRMISSSSLLLRETVAPLSPPTSSPRELPALGLSRDDEREPEHQDREIDMNMDMDMDMDLDMDSEQRDNGVQDLLNDLPPSSPPMELEGLPFDNDTDEEEDDKEDVPPQKQFEVRVPAQVPIKARDFALVAPLSPIVAGPFKTAPVPARKPVAAQASTSTSNTGFFGFDLAAPSRKNVVMRKVMVKPAVSSIEARSREGTPKVSTVKPERQREKVIEKEVREMKSKTEQGKKPVSKPKLAEPVSVVITPLPTPALTPVEAEEEYIPQTPLPSNPSLTPSENQAEVDLPTPETPLTPPPATLHPELPEPTSTRSVDPPSSPARSIYSQMTSDSEDEDEALPGQETAAVLRRLGEMKSKGGSKGVSVRVKKELIEGVVDREGTKQKKKTGIVSPLTRKEEASTATVTKQTVQPVSTPALVPTVAATSTSEKPENPTSTPQPPADLDLQALVATSVVFSGVSAISAFDLVKTILDSQPSMRDLGSDAVWTTWIGDVLRGQEMFGRVDRKGKDSSGHPLLPLYYYQPANDPDQTRAAELGACMRPLRGVQRGGGKAIDWRPVGSRGRR